MTRVAQQTCETLTNSNQILNLYKIDESSRIDCIRVISQRKVSYRQLSSTLVLVQPRIKRIICYSTDSNSTPLKITTALLNAGAKVDATDCNKRTALHYAVDTTTGGYEVVMEVEDLLIRHGADCGAVDIRGRIPLHYAFVKLGR